MARDTATVRRELARMAYAFDTLLHRPEVDPRRVAVVGHDYGAIYAAVIAARDPRVAALVALTPDATWEHWFLAYWLGLTGDQATAYAHLFTGLQPVDAVATIARRRPVLLQFADDDPYTSTKTPGSGSALRRPARRPACTTAPLTIWTSLRSPSGRRG